jgi:hypothetical protein
VDSPAGSLDLGLECLVPGERNQSLRKEEVSLWARPVFIQEDGQGRAPSKSL